MKIKYLNYLYEKLKKGIPRVSPFFKKKKFGSQLIFFKKNYFAKI